MKTTMFSIIFTVAVQLYGQDSANLEFLKKINLLRSKGNLSSLKYDGKLYIIARKWGNFLLNELKLYTDSSILAIGHRDRTYFHIKSDERFDAVLKRKDIQFIGENLYFSMDTKTKNDMVSQSFDGWKHSVSHFTLMTDPVITHVAYYHCYDYIKRRYLCISVYAQKENNGY